MNSQHRPFCIPSNIPLPHALIDAMSESLPLRLTDDWVVAMRTFDVEKLAQITSPSFTFDTVDENKNVLEFSRTQYFQNLMEHTNIFYCGNPNAPIGTKTDYPGLIPLARLECVDPSAAG